ncbi:MAG TPA: arsenate reductase (glutaredoxin) [Flavobacteriaceae bacterium]|jgi:arsenate reductase
MIEIYHNPRCGKSREGLQILETSGKDFKIITYLDEAPSKRKLKKIIRLLKIKPIELVRQNETVWIENFKDLDFTDDELIEMMAKYPILIERPIVVNGNKAVIGRPPTKILDVL